MCDRADLWERERERAVRLWDEDHTSGKFYPCDSHQHDYYFSRWISCGRKICREKYGRDFTADEWREYSVAINLICADIYKDAIEYTRVMRWTKTGVLWWSLVDMWPMLFNYSLADCDGRPKLPFYWIRQSQRELILAAVRKKLDEAATLYAINDTLSPTSGDYRITAYDENGDATPYACGRFEAPANDTTPIMQIPDQGEHRLLVIEWTVDGVTHYNHFVQSEGVLSFDVWKKWVSILRKQVFDADGV
jgi:beta-mannosidase